MEEDGVLRVAAYCRVSTDKEDQRNSLAAQRAFFQTYVEERAGWRLDGVYADEGLSGTSTARRPCFQAMIRRALAGELDLIVTKEVSRFARNTVDALQVTRKLRERGVGVLFLNDGIDTRMEDGEFRLTIMASVAQEESRKISERTRWGQLQAMRRGVVFGNDSLYGYALRGGALTVRPGQGEVVAEIFRRYLEEGKGAHTIARELTEAGVRPPLRPEGAWSSTAVLRILKNEKYCGDLVQRKYRTADYLTHRKEANDEAGGRFTIPDHHPALVSRETFRAVQEELARRGGLARAGGRASARYWWSGKVKCGLCGGSCLLKRTKRPGGGEYRRFVCRARAEGGSGCPARGVNGEVVLSAARRALEELGLDRTRMALETLAALEDRREGRAGEESRLRQALRRQEARRERALEAFLDGALEEEDLRRTVERCGEERARLQEELDRLEARGDGDGGLPEEALELLCRELTDRGEAVLSAAVRRITVYPDRLLVELEEVPVCFQIRAAGRGRGRSYRVEVEECLPVPVDRSGGEPEASGPR